MPNNSEIAIHLDSRLFSKNGIMKCLYWYSKDFTISVSIDDETFYRIILKSNKSKSQSQMLKIEKKLNEDLIDYNLSDIVKNETTTIRELIIAKAFSHGEYDEDSFGDLHDPIGIKNL